MDMQREPPFRTALVLAMRKDLDLVKKCQATSGFCELLALELRHYVAQGSQVRLMGRQVCLPLGWKTRDQIEATRCRILL
jgi:hypothetical protein